MEILLYFLGFILVFFICRELNCWYWKINKSVELLNGILEEMKKMNKGGDK